jgi:hypothetical protein
MAATVPHHGYIVALFDILGFEQRFKARGLRGMYAAYRALIEDVDGRNEHMAKLFGDMKFCEAPYWSADGEIFVFNRIQGAYASDSILLWADRTWEEARMMSARDLCSISFDHAYGWLAYPIPSDHFFDACNELMCHAIEINLPLRGAISVGAAILDSENRVFLGQPLIDVARMEKAQRFIGASLCASLTRLPLPIPKRYLIDFDEHLKDGQRNEWGGHVLDWPRHWRRTRKGDVREYVRAMNTDRAHTRYYDVTLRLIDMSDSLAHLHETEDDVSIRTQYPEFSRENKALSVRARAFRRVPVPIADGGVRTSPAAD